MMLLDPHDKGEGFSFPMPLHQLANGVGGLRLHWLDHPRWPSSLTAETAAGQFSPV
jgi:hypothetical protein